MKSGRKRGMLGALLLALLLVLTACTAGEKKPATMQISWRGSAVRCCVLRKTGVMRSGAD